MTETRSELPVACSLPQPDLVDRRAAWARLGARALRESRPTAGGVRLTYAALLGVEQELRELTRLEADCCAFAEWTVGAYEDEVILDVTAEGLGAAAVHAMFEVG